MMLRMSRLSCDCARMMGFTFWEIAQREGGWADDAHEKRVGDAYLYDIQDGGMTNHICFCIRNCGHECVRSESE